MQRRRDQGAWRSIAVLAVAAVLAVVSLGSAVVPAKESQERGSQTAAQTDAAVSEPKKESESSSKDSQDEDAKRDEYIALWAERIDAFNVGYPLEGYGATFAAAAYDYGVDPRYSPAIARVESGSGLNCTYSCNAWGWGSSSWPDWDTAIYAHVAGLAEGYGRTLSYEAALSYNELTPDEWYAQVESCMYQIWETE